MQLLIVVLQWRVFSIERIESHRICKAAGTNTELGSSVPKNFMEMHDFMDEKRFVYT